MEWKCHIPPAEHNFEHNTLVTRMTSESIKLYFFEHNPTDPKKRAAVQNLYNYVIKFSVAVVALGYQSCNGSITYPSSWDRGYGVDDSVEAARNCGDFARSLRYLKQECPLCADERPMSQVCVHLVSYTQLLWLITQSLLTCSCIDFN